MKDFARVLRAASGEQVLFYVECDEDDSWQMHCIVHLADEGESMDMAIGFRGAAAEDTAFKALGDLTEPDSADKVVFIRDGLLADLVEESDEP